MAYAVKPTQSFIQPRQKPVQEMPDTSMSPVQAITIAGKSGEKLLNTINTRKEAELINKGFLEKSRFKIYDPMGTNAVTADNVPIDMFERKAGEGFFNSKFRAPTERMQLTPEAKDWFLKQDDSVNTLFDRLKGDMSVEEMNPFFEDLGVKDWQDKILDFSGKEGATEEALTGSLNPLEPTEIGAKGFGQGAIGQGLKNMFIPQQGVAQGMPMQIAKAGMNIGKGGLQGLFAPKIAAQKAVEATLSAGGTQAAAQAAGQSAANQGLLAGAMGPLGWTMMAFNLLKLFPEKTVLGKIGKKIKKIFSDKRLKDNIVTVGRSKSGIPIKEFNYKGTEGRYRGVISEDVPWATSKDEVSGYDMVDYSKLDVSFERIQ
tara:strand:+ start:456 stop:1574 length:1119 start_codon:yes stop_codon:yes gene_type:complete